MYLVRINLFNPNNSIIFIEVINQVMTKQFPDDAQKIGLVYYQNNKPPGMETSQLLNKADDGTGSASSILQRTGYGEITDKIKNYVKDRENVTVQQIAKDLNINESNVREAYRVSPEIKSNIKKSKSGYDYDKIRDFVNSQETTSYEEIKNATGISSDNIRGFFSENPTYQNKVFNLKKKDFGKH